MPGKVRFDIAGVRKLAKERVEETSLRAVADEIGMSNSGLHSFLQGGEPYSPVRKKLVAWFMRVRYPKSRPVAAADVDAAAALLAAYIRQVAPSSRTRRFMQLSEQIAADGELTEDHVARKAAHDYPADTPGRKGRKASKRTT